MLLLFTACRPDPPPATDSAATDPWAGCPTLDWVIQVSDYLPEELHSVEALPGGDVVVAGWYGGLPRIGLGPDQILTQSQDYRDGVIARIGPDGQARWWHTIGGIAMDELQHLTVGANGELWVAGTTEVGGDNPELTVQVDRRAVWPAPGPDVVVLAWGVSFDRDGVLRDARVVELNGNAEGTVATGDPAGNTYLSGYLTSGTFSFGPWSFAPEHLGMDSSAGYSFLASWDPAGQPRWLTLLGDADSVSSPIGLAWSEGQLQWAVEVRMGGGTATAVASDGTRTRVDLGDMRGAVLAVDDDDGVVLPVKYRASTNWIHRFEQQPGGALVATGYMNYRDARWWDVAGQEHTLPGFGSFAASVDADGALLSMVSPEETLTYFHTRTGVGQTLSAATANGWPLAAGSRQEITIPLQPGRDGLVFIDDEHGDLRCLSWFSGPGYQDALDAVFDDLGGYVVVGTFEQTMGIFEPGGERASLQTYGEPQDAFVARFAPPDE